MPTRPSDGSPDWFADSEVRAFAHAHFIDVFTRADKRKQIGLLLTATLMAFLWSRSGDLPWVAAWWLLVLAYTVVRFKWTDRLIKNQPEKRSARRILWMLCLSGFLLAVPLWWFDRFSEAQKAAFTIIMCSTAAASVSTTAGYRLYFLAYVLPVLVSLQMAWIASQWSEGLLSTGVGLAGLILAYIAVLVSVGQQSFATFLESCRIRFGERDLNRQLSAALQRESEANRAKTQFLAAASHDLRQPIHSLNVLVAALGQRPLDERSREIVKLLQSVNESLSSELDSLLEISKLDADAVQPELAPISISNLLVNHSSTLVPLAKELGIRVDVRVTDGLFGLTDAVLLHRVIGNLTSNALKFTPPGGLIRLSASSEGDTLTLAVEDNGIGMASEHHERVFSEFYQVSNTERDRNRGLGLGLSIVKRYCDLLNIGIELESAVGNGTRVSLSLPALVGIRAPADRSTVEADHRFPADFTVLLLDDEAQIRESMRLVMAEWGIRLYAVESVHGAQAVLRDHRVDFVLSDLRLRDGESGLDVLGVLKSLQLNIPLALITGDTAPDRIALARQAGVPLHYKPVSANTLLALLRSAVP